MHEMTPAAYSKGEIPEIKQISVIKSQSSNTKKTHRNGISKT
jgi:hypothetical protein